jgi:two-component system, chemotaxis family, CheB/CheR fusion protein
VSLKPKVAFVIGLALHELITNARQYGSLSGSEGRVSLDWTIDAPAAGEARLVVEWRELNGPPVQQPHNNGFGYALFKRQLPDEIGAEAGIEFPPHGVEAHIAVPTAGNMVVAG